MLVEGGASSVLRFWNFRPVLKDSEHRFRKSSRYLHELLGSAINESGRAARAKPHGRHHEEIDDPAWRRCCPLRRFDKNERHNRIKLHDEGGDSKGLESKEID